MFDIYIYIYCQCNKWIHWKLYVREIDVKNFNRYIKRLHEFDSILKKKGRNTCNNRSVRIN